MIATDHYRRLHFAKASNTFYWVEPNKESKIHPEDNRKQIVFINKILRLDGILLNYRPHTMWTQSPFQRLISRLTVAGLTSQIRGETFVPNTSHLLIFVCFEATDCAQLNRGTLGLRLVDRVLVVDLFIR
jgi:hypothetical protein